MNIVIVAHHSRLQQAERLRDQVAGTMVVDWESRGALWGHVEALRLASSLPGRSVVMEDDAEPVDGFRELARGWMDRFPDELLSFYCGTGRPKHWLPIIRAEMDRPGDHIALNELIHGVCYTIPPEMVGVMLSTIPGNKPADYAIGWTWRNLTGRKVIYPKLSLVDHADGPSVERHPDGQKRTEIRRAWRLANQQVAQ